MNPTDDKPENVPLLPEVGGGPPKSQTNLDWEAYFKEFCARHGSNPLHYGGTLLFSDGWTYSSTDYAGPEWPPPQDREELRLLLRHYWLRRRAIVNFEYVQLGQHLTSLEDMQRLRKVPLQQVVKWFDTENKRWSKDVGPLDLDGMRGRLQWLREDIAECDKNLKELEPCQPPS